MSPTKLRTMRVSDDLWNAAKARAESEGSSVTAVIVAALKLYADVVTVPAFWRWAIPPGILKQAASCRASLDNRDAVNCLMAWCPACSVCGERDRLVPDHDHLTGYIRGLLCLQCNSQEPHQRGVFDHYRKVPPADVIGLQVVFWGWRPDESCPHPRRRVLKGFCGACGTAVRT